MEASGAQAEPARGDADDMSEGPGRAALVMAWLVKCAVVIVVSGGIGALIGVGLSELTSDGGRADAPAATAPASGSDVRNAAAPPVAPKPVNLHVVVRDAVLHPAGTLDGERRRRARLTVRVAAQNRGDSVITPTRPVLVTSGTRTPADPQADGPGTKLGPLAPGESAAVTLRFETAGDATTKLSDQRRARVEIGGQTVALDITLGNPVAVDAGG